MSFGLNRTEVIDRLDTDVTVNHLVSGGRVANLNIASDESYIDIDKNNGERVDKTERHRAVTFQPGLVDMLVKHTRKGRLIYVASKLQTRRGRKEGEDSDRFSTRSCLRPVRGCSSSIAITATARRSIRSRSDLTSTCFRGEGRVVTLDEAILEAYHDLIIGLKLRQETNQRENETLSQTHDLLLPKLCPAKSASEMPRQW